MLAQEDDQQLVERVQRATNEPSICWCSKYQHKILGLWCVSHDSHEAQDVAQKPLSRPTGRWQLPW